MNLAVLEGVGQIFQHWLFKGLVPQCETLYVDVNLCSGCCCVACFLLLGFTAGMTRFHSFQDVSKRPHLHHGAVESAHGRHDAVGADGHEGQQFQETGLGCSLHQRDDDGTRDGSHG